jgi:hypothetical protein
MLRILRRGAAVVACAAIGLGVAVADASTAVAPGRYEGRTAQTQFMMFNVAPDRRAVVQLAVGVVGMDCSDGNQTTVPIRKTPKSKRYRLDSKGRFTVTPPKASATGDYRVRGHVKGHRATGTVRMTARVNARGAPDPAGEVTCDSGTVAWSVKLK